MLKGRVVLTSFFILAALAATATPASASVVLWSKTFLPDTIGPGSTSTLEFLIVNQDEESPADAVAFTDTLPAGVTIGPAPQASATCGGTLSAPAGGGTITFSGGKIGTFSTCLIRVNVISSTVGTHTNTTGTLTSSLGSHGTATDDLTVDAGRPGFTKFFAPSTVGFGGRSTLTFTVDNTANASPVVDLSFEDTLPPGVVIAEPANAETDCETSTIPATLTADPGTSLISLDANGNSSFPPVAAGASCTVLVDVVGSLVGTAENVSGTLTSIETATVEEAGKASASLVVTGFADPLTLEKEFVDDPTPPGGIVKLKFTVTNRDRDDAATGISFSDDLGATLTGLAPSGPLPTDPCGGGSSLGFAAGVLTLSGGTLAPEASCVFTVSLLVPAGAAPATYPNSAGPVTGTIGGEPETGNVAGDLLFVVTFPLLTKEFIDDPVGGGGSVTLEFTITNTNSGSSLSDIAFVDVLTAGSSSSSGAPSGGFLPRPVSVTLPPVPDPPCGAGSSLTLASFPIDQEGLSLTGGSLAAAGSPGDSCTFEVTVDIPVGFPDGTYTNTTRAITAKLADLPGTPKVTGKKASDTIVVRGAPQLSKEFTDDPVAPGGTVTVKFTLVHDEAASADATGIAFTDDLTTLVPAVPGLTAASVATNTCTGSTVDITTTPTEIAFSGGTLMPGEECDFSVTLSVPAGAASGKKKNTTSEVTATVAGVTTQAVKVSDDLVISGLLFSKEFTDDPVIPGGTVDLKFTLDNTSGSVDATSIFFTDSLGFLPGLAATGTPFGACGGTVSGTFTIIFIGGSVTAGTSCDFTVTLSVPPPEGVYGNVTSDLSAVIGSPVSLPGASDTLTVEITRLELTKEFTNDPAVPGGTVKVKFTLENLDPVNTASAIDFSDDLGSALPGLVATSSLANSCGGMGAGIGTGVFSYTGGTLAGGATCTIELLLTLPAAPLPAGPFINSTSSVFGKITGLTVTGEPASDELLVQEVTFTKEFDGPTVAGGSVLLTFTITNLSATSALTDLAFSDALPVGLARSGGPVAGVCSGGSTLAGTGFLTLTGGSLAGSGSCSFGVTLSVPAGASPGDFLNSTSSLFSNGLPVAGPATDFLTIEPPPAFSKAFAPSTVEIGDVSTLTFTIDNSASSFAATGLAFTDTLPAGLVVASPSGATTDCTGGTLTAASGGGTIGYTGGEVAAGAVCTISVDVTPTASGSLVNVTGALTSSSGNSGTATDTLSVPPGADLKLTKTDRFEPVVAGHYQIYTLKVENLGPLDAFGVTLTDPLPPKTTFVYADPASAGCSAAGGVVTCALGTLTAGSSVSVTIQIFVDADAANPIDNFATVTATTGDPNLSNNDVLQSTEVLAFTDMAVLADANGNGFPEAAVVQTAGSVEVLVKDMGTTFLNLQREFFPAGWTPLAFDKTPDLNFTGSQDLALVARQQSTGELRLMVRDGLDGKLISSTALNPSFRPLAMHVIPDNGFGTSLIALAARRDADGKSVVFLRNAATGANAGQVGLHPAFWPIDLTTVPSFVGGPGPELAVLQASQALGQTRVLVRELSGAAVSSAAFPASTSPLGLETVPNFSGTTAPEVAVLGWDRSLDRIRVRVIEATGTPLTNRTSFGTAAAPKALRTVPNFGGTLAPELAVLFRQSPGKAVVRVRDAVSDAQLRVSGFGPAGSIPLDLELAPNFGGTLAPELAVYYRDPVSGNRRVDVRDASSGGLLSGLNFP